MISSMDEACMIEADDNLRTYFFIWYERRVRKLLYSLLRIFQTW